MAPTMETIRPVTERASLALAALLAVSSVVGIANGGSGLYASYPASLAGMVGQDLVSLVVAVPLLVAAARLARRGSARATLVLAGVLFSVAYGYAFYVFGGFNALFLVYALIVAVALYTLLGLLVPMDPAAVAVPRPGLPRRPVALFLLAVGTLFVVMWGGMTMSMISAGGTPDPVAHGVLFMDTTVLLPVLLVGGWLLWRASPWGHALGAILLVKLILTGGTLAFNTVLNLAWTGQLAGLDAFLLVIFGLMAVIGLALIGPYLRHLAPGPRPAAAPAGLANLANVAGGE